MANITDIERLNYYEGEYLGAVDFEAEQEYHRDMRRRHNVGQHTWGIVSGLDLAQIPNGGPNNQVDVNLMPGMAIDAFGREIVVLSQTQLTEDAFAPYYDPNPSAAPKYMYLWIAYDQSMTQTSQQTCASTSQANAFARVQESYRIAVTPTPTSPPSDAIVVDGTSLSPPPEGTSTPPPPPPGEIVLSYDGSVPYQEFADDDTTVTWLVPLGRVKWDPHNEVFLQLDPAAAAAGRIYAGAIAAALYAPAGSVTIESRNAPYPLPASPSDPNFAGVSVEVAGSLQVDRLLNPLANVLIGATFNPADTTPLSPLTINAEGTDEELIQFRSPSGQETWHICENLGGNNPGINIVEFVKGNPVNGRLFIQATQTASAVASPQNVGVGTMTPRNPLGIRGQGSNEELLSFEDSTGNTRWHLNQNLQGATPSGQKFVRGLNFAESGVSDYRLFLQSGGNVGVGTPLPQQNLSVNAGLNIDQANLNGGQLSPGLTFGSASGEGLASNRSGGANQFGLDFYTESAVRMSITQAGLVGLGTNVPDAQLHLTGGQWNLGITEGDFKIGNDQLRLKCGVALGGAGAGDARIRAQGGTNRLMLGSGVTDTVTLQNANVGINNINPARALDIAGDVHITGSLWVEGSKAGYVVDRFIYHGAETLERGDVVVLHLAPSGKTYGVTGRIPLIEVDLTDIPLDTHVCGIVDEPVLAGVNVNDLDPAGIGTAKVGLMVTLGAYMFCKVDASAAPIEAGDLLTTSTQKGYAQRLDSKKAGRSNGAVIGKALASRAEGKGIIPVLVSHQ